MRLLYGDSLRIALGSAIAIVSLTASAGAQMRITEYQYTGGDITSEFIEFTNVGVTSVNMSGWSFDDSDHTDGPHTDLSAFGTVAAGQSVILCEATAAGFRTAWALSGSVAVIGANPNNLGRNDQLNLYDNNGALVDQLTYGDQSFPGSIRTNGKTGWPCSQAVGANNPFGWRNSANGDAQGSFVSSFLDIGNPGQYTNFVCPPDPTGACCAGGACSIQSAQVCYGQGLYQGNSTVCVPNTCPAPSGAQVRITEFMHTGTGGEFIEFRNFGGSPVNMAGWHFSDETRAPGQVDLSGFGTVAAGEAVILTESIAADFRTDWGLSGTVKVVGGNTINIGKADEINLYDNSGALVDRLTYGQLHCAPDAEGGSAYPCSAAIGNNDILEWRKAHIGDTQGSHASLVGDLGNPGAYTSVTCNSGSCCVNNVCSVLSQGDCLNVDGLFLGEGTNCGSTPCPAADNTQVRITEFMYLGTNGEFFEITNLGASPVNLSGWTFADLCQPPGQFQIGGIGTLGPGQSAIVTDKPAGTFSTAWSISGVPIATLPSNELGRNDQITIHNASKAVVDTLHYGDETYPASVLTQNVSAWPAASAVGQDRVGSWVLSSIGDPKSSHASSGGDVGNPGTFVSTNVPAASTWGLVAFVILLMTVGTILARRTQFALMNR